MLILFYHVLYINKLLMIYLNSIHLFYNKLVFFFSFGCVWEKDVQHQMHWIILCTIHTNLGGKKVIITNCSRTQCAVKIKLGQFWLFLNKFNDVIYSTNSSMYVVIKTSTFYKKKWKRTPDSKFLWSKV